MGHSIGTELQKQLQKEKDVLDMLKQHPNFKMPNPNVFQNAIAYACACVAMLISPPQEEGESNHIECVDLSAAIRLFHQDITKAWLEKELTGQ